MRNFIGKKDFIWFVGVVEDRNDPIQMGRSRVRAFGWHTDDKTQIPTESLPWALTINEVQSASISGVGRSTTGLVEGSWVVGFFLDGESAQEPVIIGSLAGVPSELPDTTKGFFDPNGVYPKEEFINEQDVNRLARDETNDLYKEHDVIAWKQMDRTLNVQEANGKGTWDEPPYARKTVYPHNHVKETESGHIKEYDDTEGAERIHEYHKEGTFYEIQPDGTKVTRVVSNNYTVVFGDDFVNVKGNVNLTVDSNCTTYIKGDWDIQVDGNVNEVIKGTLTQNVSGNVNETYGSNQKTQISGNLDVDASRIDLN